MIKLQQNQKNSRMKTLKKAAMAAYDLVERSDLDAAQAKLAALQNAPTVVEFAVVQDVDGNSYNTEGEMITVGQEFKTGDVEGEGDLVVDASVELEDGSVIATDADGVVSEIQMAGSATEDDTEDTEDDGSGDEQSNDQLSKEAIALMMDGKLDSFSKDFLKQIEGLLKEMKKSAKEVGEFKDHINQAPAATHQSAKRRSDQSKSNSLADQLSKSVNQ